MVYNKIPSLTTGSLKSTGPRYFTLGILCAKLSTPSSFFLSVSALPQPDFGSDPTDQHHSLWLMSLESFWRANLGLSTFTSYLSVSTRRRAVRFFFQSEDPGLLIPHTAGSGTSEHCQTSEHSLELGVSGPIGSDMTEGLQ